MQAVQVRPASEQPYRRPGLLAAALVFVAATSQTSIAQSIYDGNLTSTEQKEVDEWSKLFWDRKDNGGSPGVGFSFSTPAMNGHLFNPVRAARPTLEHVGEISVDECDALELFGSADVVRPEVTAALRQAMLHHKVETSSTTNPVGTVAHANLILAAPPDPDLNAYFVGDVLVSENLPPLAIGGNTNVATMPEAISDDSKELIALLVNSGPLWVATTGGTTEAMKLITGEPSKADKFAEEVDALLKMIADVGATTQIYYAHFGVYGQLPIVSVTLSDCMVLMDPTNGNLSGPFARNSTLDATGLLSAHPGVSVTAADVKYYTVDGCAVPVGATWNPGGPPVPTTPRAPITNPGQRRTCPPPGSVPPPFYPAAPCYNPTIPGWVGCTCSITPASTTVCTEVTQEIGGTPPKIYHRVRYYTCNLATPGAVGCPIPTTCVLHSEVTYY